MAQPPQRQGISARPNSISIDEIRALIPKRVTAKIALPSGGTLYDRDIVKDGMVELVPMSAREVKLIAGSNNLSSAVDTILSRCLITKLDPDQLLLGDRFFLYLALRANSYGEDYPFNFTCGTCRKTSRQIVKIPADLPIKAIPAGTTEPMSVTLPCGLTVEYRFIRSGDQKKITKLAKDEIAFANKMATGGRRDEEEGDPEYFYTLAVPIVSLDGKAIDLLTAVEFVKELPSKDALYLEQTYAMNTPGVDTLVTKQCKFCDADITASLPLTAVEIFRPDVISETDSGRKAEPDGAVRV